MPEGTGEGTGTGTGTGTVEKPAWVAQLPADLKDNEAFTGFKTIGDLAKAHLETSGKVKEFDGMKAKLDNSIPKLNPDAKPEEREAFYAALGRPAKPEEYKFDGDNLDDKTVKWAQATFFQAGLTADQAKQVSGSWNGFIKQIVETAKTQAVEEERLATEALKKDLGDQFEATKTLASRLWKKHFGDDAEINAFLTTPTREGMLLGNNPFLIRLFAKLAKLTGEDTSPAGSPDAGKSNSGKNQYTEFYEAIAVKK